MRRLLLLLSLIALPGCGAEMKEFSPDGTFTIVMAGTPKEDRQQSPLGVTTTTYTVEERSGFYALSVSDYGNDRPWIPEEVEGRFKAIRDTLLSTYKARLVSEDEVKLADRYEGRKLEAALTEREGLLRARYYVAKGRLYQLTAVGAPKWANSDEVNRFLGSLTVKE